MTFSVTPLNAPARQNAEAAAVEIIRHSDRAKGVEILPRQWGVECTFGWVIWGHRLVKDYEQRIDVAEPNDLHHNGKPHASQKRSYLNVQKALRPEEDIYLRKFLRESRPPTPQKNLT